MKNKVLVIGGMHGNEALGLELVTLLKKKPIKGVDAVIANPRAVKTKTRFTESDMNRSFGTEFMGSYETKRASWLKRKANKYELVLDFHNTQTPKNNSCFVGENCQSTLYDVAKNLGLSDCIIASYDCINKVCPNTLSIEISSGDQLDQAVMWYELLKKPSLVKKSVVRLNTYAYLKRVTWQEKEKFCFSDWQPFVPLNTRDKKQLGVSGIIVPIFIGSRLTQYWATLLKKKEVL
jgi:hypothetical protein